MSDEARHRSNEDDHSHPYTLVCQDHPAQLLTLPSSSQLGPSRRQGCVRLCLHEERASLVEAGHLYHRDGWIILGLVRKQPI